MDAIIDDILKLVKTYNKDEFEIVKSAYEYAKNLHIGKIRHS